MGNVREGKDRERKRKGRGKGREWDGSPEKPPITTFYQKFNFGGFCTHPLLMNAMLISKVLRYGTC